VNAARLPAELTIYTVGELYPHCLEWLSRAGSFVSGQAPEEQLRVDAAAVAEVDAAGVQLLLSLANALRPHAQSLVLDHPSPALARACSALGASTLLDGSAAKGTAE